MKLRKAIKLASAAAAITASSSALALGPSLGGYTSDASDNISTSGAGGVCAGGSGYTCSTTPIQEAGFLQMIVTEDSTGDKYIHSVLTEGETADGGLNFAGAEGVGIENFVRMGGGSGINSQQRVQENVSVTTTGGGTESEVFKTAAYVAAGDFRTDNVVAIDVEQSIVETLVDSGSAFVDSMTSNFRLQEQDDSNISGYVTAKVNISNIVKEAEFSGSLSMESYTVEDTTLTGTNVSTLDYKKIDADATLVGEVQQQFMLRERVGAASQASGGGSMVAALTVDDGGSNATWSAGDTIVNLIIEQNVTDAGAFGLNDFANESNQTAHGIDKFSDSNASAFQTSTPTVSTEDPFTANNTSGWFN